MFLDPKISFLFRCEDCAMILSVELEDEDIEKVRENKLELECPCGSSCKILRN